LPLDNANRDLLCEPRRFARGEHFLFNASKCDLVSPLGRELAHPLQSHGTLEYARKLRRARRE
jgi:hypothetical protein